MSCNSHEHPGATGDSVVTSVSSRLLLKIVRNSIHCLGIEILNSVLFTRRTFSPTLPYYLTLVDAIRSTSCQRFKVDSVNRKMTLKFPFPPSIGLRNDEYQLAIEPLDSRAATRYFQSNSAIVLTGKPFVTRHHRPELFRITDFPWSLSPQFL